MNKITTKVQLLENLLELKTENNSSMATATGSDSHFYCNPGDNPDLGQQGHLPVPPTIPVPPIPPPLPATKNSPASPRAGRREKMEEEGHHGGDSDSFLTSHQEQPSWASLTSELSSH